MERNHIPKMSEPPDGHGHQGIKSPQEPWSREDLRTKGRIRVPAPGPPKALSQGMARAPELEPEGEAFLGPADSQAPWAMAGWKKGAPVPVPGGGPARAPEPEQVGEASLGPVDSQAWALRIRQAGGRERPPQGPAGVNGIRSSLNTDVHGSPPQNLSWVPCHLVGQRARPGQRLPPQGPLGPLKPNWQPSQAQWFPRPGPLRLRQAGGRDCPRAQQWPEAWLELSERSHA
ncbi:hypothetical protein NDU88_003388 [Pleurodeles waltl]|uniref:Uncharacterized protein n=1 Tax=Pleurodeles waltl TaxID=8319 RepID=A0AAV7LMY1_PLEWA|nr:hypothetical protein NDU88_003388 [Pleurodeles waltl]